MFKSLINVFKVADIRKRFLFTMLILVVFRIGAQIPVPGVDLNVLLDAASRGPQNDTFNFITLFMGSGLTRASIFSLGIMPYITAMIIMQLLKAVVPKIEMMVKEGPEGRKKLQQWGRYLTVVITLVQGFMWVNMIPQNAIVIDPTIFKIFFAVTVTAGTLILMWMGEQITEKGIGNGISLLIMVGIVVRLPVAIYTLFNKVTHEQMDPMNLMIVIAVFVLVIGVVVFEEMGLRRIPVQYSKRFVGSGNYAGQVSFLPFKVNPTGVIPIIFASAILTFPGTIQNFVKAAPGTLIANISNALLPGNFWYSVVYFLFIIFFAYFYTEIEINPNEIAENLRKQQGFIPGIRPGQQTAEHIYYVLNRITLPGAIFLGIIALMPTFINKWMGVPQALGYIMGGTSLLIMVGVALDTLKQLESHLMMHHFGGILTPSKKK